MQLYRLLLSFWVVVVAIAGAWRVLRGRETLTDLRERLGLVGAPETDAPYIWLHTASNGELASIRPLLTRLADDYVDIPLLITTNSLTGRDLARSLGYPALLAPVDTRRAARRMLAGARAHATVEAELWPNRLIVAAQQGKPVVLLSTRLSARTARLWSRLPALRRAVLQAARLIVPQDRASAARLEVLGADPSRITPPLDFKAFYTAPSRRIVPALDAACPPGRTWLAASTHPGEEEAILDAHATLRGEIPDLVLILAPRHVTRAGDLGRLLDRRGMSYQRHSQDIRGQSEVILADTMGEMALWYDRAGVTFVGGSLVERGGHTPHEPLAHGSVVLHGPHLRNFAWVYARIDTATPSARVTGAPALVVALRKLMDRDTRADWLLRQTKAVATTTDLDAMHRALAAMTGAASAGAATGAPESADPDSASAAARLADSPRSGQGDSDLL